MAGASVHATIGMQSHPVDTESFYILVPQITYHKLITNDSLMYLPPTLFTTVSLKMLSSTQLLLPSSSRICQSKHRCVGNL